MRPLARLALAIALFAAAVFLPSRARAAMMPHYDMVSLALEADAIVRGRVVGERRQDQWTTFKTIEIVRAYKGPLKVGDHVELSYDLYSMRPMFEGAGPADAGRPELGPDIVFFLGTARRGRIFMVGGPPIWQPRQGERLDPTSIKWTIVPSGVRTFLGGKAQQFVQWSNPGGYGPVPQVAEDGSGDPRDGLDLAGLEREIERASASARAIQAALEAADSPSRRDRLVELAAGGGSAHEELFFYDNRAGTYIVETLAQLGDMPRTLLAASRARGASLARAASPFASGALFDVAGATKSPLPVRLAAIDLLETQWSELRKETDADSRVITLMRDPEPQIRAAILRVHPTEKASAAMRAAIAQRFVEEPVESVRIALFHAARAHEMLALLPRGKEPLIAARRIRDRITIGWADLDERANWMVADSSRVTVTLGGKTTSLPVFGEETSYSNGASGELAMRITDPALVAGKVELHLDLEDLGTKRVVRRVLALDAPPAVDAPAAANGGATFQDAGSDAVVVPMRPAQRRCGCATEGEGPASAAALLPLLAVVYLARRRR